jgi:molecular chaperone GrpE (heat shock protein)
MIRESSDRLKFFNLDLIKELLPSQDNLERAISHAKIDNTDWAKMDNEYLEISSVSGAGIPELIIRIGKLLDEN